MHLPSTQPSMLARLRDPEDHEAWRLFDRRYREMVLRYTLRNGVTHADAEDVCQNVMVSLARRLPEFRYDPAQGRFRHYLRRVITNAVNRLHRRPRADRVQWVDTLDAESPEVVDMAFEEEWRNHHYRLAMDKVRETSEARSVEVFTELLAGECAVAVAERRGMTREAVAKIRQRIKARLRCCIAEQIAEEDRILRSPPERSQA